jgi:hypothetical protein
MPVTRERADRIARATACPRCREYTWKRVRLRDADPGDRHVGAAWSVELTCGVCDKLVQLAIDDDGDVVYIG